MSPLHVVTAWDALELAAGRARELDGEIRAELRQQVVDREWIVELRRGYFAALGETLIWTTKIMGSVPAGALCPFCAGGDS